MDQAFIEEQKKLIDEQISALEKEIVAAKHDEIGDASEDNATEFEEFEGSVALSEGAKKELAELKQALGKIENGNYGICERCGNPIEKGRLRAYPAAKYCATHAA